MCGIIGIIGKLPEKSEFDKARDSLEHRGPDDYGTFYDKKKGIALGHRRLSIIDLSKAGRQPFLSNDKRYFLVYNGEIYNYLELKDELKDFYDFKTQTDTEVLLAAYIRWGEKCLKRFNGMFAFAIWDKKEEKLFCARDRLGIKPFFYYRQNNTLYFASEIKGILNLGVKREVNETAVFDYLYHGFYDHNDETFFKHIKKLPQGSFMEVKDGDAAITKYWDLEFANRGSSGLNKEEAGERFKELLADSIKLRFRSDVPVGINLSSGLDSNTLLFYSKKVLGRDIHTFSRCLPSEEYNECGIIENILNDEQKKFWHTCTLHPAEMMSLASLVNRIEDQPYGSIFTIGSSKMYPLAKEKGVKVLLEGQGLDELLAGYKYYLIEHDKDINPQLDNSAHSSINLSQDATKLIDIEILDKDFVKNRKHQLSFRAPFKSHLLNAQYRDLFHTKLPRVLRFNDHISMAYGRELRVPYLDHRIVEFCFYLPDDLKIDNGRQKALVRDVMGKYLPNVVSAGKKKAFGAVQTEWFRKHLSEDILSFVESESFKSRPYWDHKYFAEKVKRFLKGEGDNSFFIWQAVNLDLWFREFID